MPLNLLACGSNPGGQLSLNHSHDVHTFTHCSFHSSLDELLASPDAEIVDLVSASNHSLLLLHAAGANHLLGCGTNTEGQLGPRCALWDEVKPELKFKPVDMLSQLGLKHEDWDPVKVACTWTTSFVVYRRLAREQSSGSSSATSGHDGGMEQIVVSCGSNDFGEMGITASSGMKNASDNPSIIDVGLEPGETIKMLKGGQRHVMAVVHGPEGDRLVGWGAARKGELDTSQTAHSHTKPVTTKVMKSKIKADIHPRSSLPKAMNLQLPVGSEIAHIALGTSHSVILLSDGRVKAWGSDAHGQIRDLDQARDVEAIGSTWNGTYILDKSGKLRYQGSPGQGQTGSAPTDPVASSLIAIPDGGSIQQFACGSEHLLMDIGRRNQSSDLFVRGWNEHGNLGLGDQKDRQMLTRVDIGAGKIRRLWGGCAASWVWMDPPG